MERDDIELIQSVLSGDDAAFSDLVQRYQKGVHALAWRKIGDFHIAEEITQDTFLQAHKKLASLKNPSQFAGWLYVIADRRCKAWFRKKKLWTQSLETTSEETLEKAAYADYVCEQREETAVECRREIVQKLMEKLPESERTVMVLHYLGEMSCEAISKFLGVSPNTVKSRLKRARERLQNEESIIRETLGSVPLRPDLTENIMRRIDTIKQTSPSGGKPLLPFAALGATAILVILLMGASKQLITNFQQPYNVDAKSEPTIEIVDTSIVLDIQSKPELQNRVGGANINENSNNGLTKGTETVKNNLTQESMQWNLPENAKARLGKGKIYEIQYSPDGAILAVASGIGIWLYDTTTHQEISLLTEHTSVVDCLAFSPDGRTFASGSRDGTILLWGYKSADGSVSVKTKLTVDRGEISGLNLAFSPDGKTLASGTGDTIQFWDTITGEQKSALTSFNTFLSFSPDGTTIIVCVDRNGTISLWNPITGKHKKTVPGHIDRVVSVALSPNGKTIAMGSDDGPIHLYDLDTSENKITLSGHKWQVLSLMFSSDGKMLVSGGWDQTVRLWDVNTGEHKQTLTGHTDWVQSVAFSPNGKTISSQQTGDGTIRFWDVDTGTPKNIITGHTAGIGAIAFSPHNKETITIEHGDGTILFWDTDTGQHIKTLNEFRDAVASGAVRNIKFTPDGKILAWGDEGMRLWDEDTNEYKMILKISEWGNHSVALSPDGNIIAIAFDKDNLIKLWDMHTSEQKLTLTGHTKDILRLAFSPDSKTLASTSLDEDAIRLWDTQTGENTEVFVLDSAWRRDVADWWGDRAWWGLAFSPDGKTLAGGGGEIILLWDIDTGKTKMRLTMPTHRVFDLAFSPDGKSLASAGYESNINLWDPYTGKHKKTLTGHKARVRSIAFSPDGKTLVSSGDGGTVLIWKINP
ncbi:MAG: sigma-70 family RNA polymerase sigma factor [Candidatus Poribacteria bacterium]|nr:sigma-70 family RNA polymerase sigma factor [Candidatus Poribacteria bacterium]